MRFRTRNQATAAVGVAVACLLLAASPASAAVVPGELTAGAITVAPNYGLGELVFDLSGGTPHVCSDPDGPQPTIDVDVVGDGASGTTEVVDTDFDTSYIDFIGTTLALDISLDAAGDQDGTYGGLPSPYDVRQDLGLTIAVYETTDCVAGDLVCTIDAQFALTGAFTGTISPPATGMLALDGSGMLSAPLGSCDTLLAFAFHGAAATVDNLTVAF